MTLIRLAQAMALGSMLFACSSASDSSPPVPIDSGSTSAGGSGGSISATGGSGGSTISTGGSGGSVSSGGSGGSIASGGSGGSTAPDAASSGSPDSGAPASADASTSTEAATYFKRFCECPVLSGFSPAQFCEAYTEICGYTGTNRYKDEAACKSTFKGMSNDGDAKKSGALCCAYKMPDMKEARCAAAK